MKQKHECTHCRNHYTNHDQPTPPQHTAGDSVEHQSCGGHSTGETPSNIPNLEAKPGSANGTATDGLWESRTPPQHTLGKRPGTQRFLAAPLSHTAKPGVDDRHTQNHTQQTHQPQRQIRHRIRTTPRGLDKQLPHKQTVNNLPQPQHPFVEPIYTPLDPPLTPQRVQAGKHRPPCAWAMLAAVWLWCDTRTDLCRPHFASWHGMLEAWSLLHIREGRTATGGATRYSPSAWRRTTASPINPR